MERIIINGKRYVDILPLWDGNRPDDFEWTKSPLSSKGQAQQDVSTSNYDPLKVPPHDSSLRRGRQNRKRSDVT